MQTPPAIPCMHCGSAAVVAGRCVTCGQFQTQTGVRRPAKKAAKARTACTRHRFGTPAEVGPYAGRREQRCKRCGARRTVEA